MNSISSNLTASSILSNKTSAPIEKKEQAEVREDRVEVGTKEADDSSKGLKNFIKSELSESKNPFSPADHKKGIAIGAASGGVVGGVVGGLVGHSIAMDKVRATNEINSISLDWQEPVMRSEYLGSIPANYYQPNNIFGIIGGGNGTQDIYRENPVMQQNGQPLMQDVSKTYTDYGEPVVSWDNKNIQKTTLTSYSTHTYADTETVRYYEGTDQNGNPIYSTHEEVKGFNHTFSPNFARQTVGNYSTPKVKFETGVNVGLHTTLGVLAGAGVGALTGALAGAAISHIVNK